MAMNPFQQNSIAPAAKTSFGQSMNFGNNSFQNQRLHPPNGGFGSQPLGGVAGGPPPPSNGFAGALTSGKVIGQKKSSKNKKNMGTSTTFGQNNALSSSTTVETHTTFGTASNSTSHNNRGSRLQLNMPKTAFGSNKSTSFNGVPFSGNDGGFSSGQTVFGDSTSQRGQDSFVQISNGIDSKGFPVQSSSPAVSFGNKASNVRARKQNSKVSTRSDNPFITDANQESVVSGPLVRTTFGDSTFSLSFPAFKPSPTDATVSGAKKQPNSAAKFRSEGSARRSKNLDSVETRMNGAKQSQFVQGKRSGAFSVASDKGTAPFNGQQTMVKTSPTFLPDNDTFGSVVTSNPMSEKRGKHRQPRQRKKTPSNSDEESIPTIPFIAISSQDENSKAELSAATNLDGLCVDMCSPVERELHIRVDELSVFEKCFPDRLGAERDMIIKRFQRSSADHKLNIPEEIRPPGVLRRTQLYIEQEIMDLDQFGVDPRFQTPRVPEPIELYNFCWDRFRMIRKDFVLQNYRGAGGRVHPIALDIHERIARYHVLSEHELIQTPSFVAQQNMEQLGQTLKSLNELYDESYKVGDPAYLSPFEAECRAYFILCTLDNGRGMDVLKYVKNLPRRVVDSPHMKFAMRVFVARHTADYFQFFSLLRQATYLQSCLLFRYIPNVRSSALLRMNRAYRGQTYPLEDLVELLCFDDLEHAYAVCLEHHLSISSKPGAGDDSSVAVKFGGDFETDIQLRRKNTPLKIRSSKIYVGMKQGNYLRRDICRGVTEYARNEYPALSKLIQTSEQEERARLYPDRPDYADDYSHFIDYNDGVPISFSTSTQANNVSTQHHRIEYKQKKNELDAIARKKLELEQKKQEMLERMRELEKTKEEKTRRELAKKAAVEQSKKQEIAQATAEKMAAEAERQQQVLEARLREQMKEHELQQMHRKAEEAREAEKQRLIAIQQVERIKAVEKERRRQEEKRQEELRLKAAEEEKLERLRQQKLAEDRARQAREAALEAQRQAKLAKERAEKKRVRRTKKQQHAVLKLRLQIWKKYVEESRGPGQISINACKLQLDRPHQKAKDSVRWLFQDAHGTIGLPISTKRPKLLANTEQSVPHSAPELLSFWSAEDIVSLVSGSLRQRNPGVQSIAWKLVIADLLDEKSTSFGLWCAVRAGAQNVSTLKRDCFRTFHEMSQNVAVCTRYLDSTFAQQNSHETQREKLAATSAILLPVNLSTMEQAGKCAILEQRLEDLLSSLEPTCRVALFILGLASTECKASQGSFVSTLQSCVERIQNQFPSQVMKTSIEVLSSGDNIPVQFNRIVKKIATLSPRMRHFKSVGFREFLENNVKVVMNQCKSSIGILNVVCAGIMRMRRDIVSSGIMDITYPPPELQFAVLDPPHGWNSQERQHEIHQLLTILESTRIFVERMPVDCIQTCDVYFKKVEDFIDQLFAFSSTFSTYELKKRIYAMFLPVHENLIKDANSEQITPQEADVLLPWRKIFGEIYSAFFETLGDITIYYPANWVDFGSRDSSVVDVANNVAPEHIFTPIKTTTLDKTDAKPVHVSMQSLRRSFGVLSDIDDTMHTKRVRSELKRLRVEIEQERAASSQFQHMLRNALNQ